MCYGKEISAIETDSHKKVRVKFKDGTIATSELVVGCDGANSSVRKLLFSSDPGEADLTRLSIRAMGSTLRPSTYQMQFLRSIDPLLFQGCHPKTGVFLWYSLLSTPETNHSNAEQEPYYEVQIFVSWLWKTEADDVPNDNAAMLRKLGELTFGFDVRLKDIIASITETREVRLVDWPTKEWPNYNGHVTLAGDAAHAMTMYRGEAFNHGIADAAELSLLLEKVRSGALDLGAAIKIYEAHIYERTHDAVLLSRQACFDAHDLSRLTMDSAIVKRRAFQLPDGLL